MESIMKTLFYLMISSFLNLFIHSLFIETNASTTTLASKYNITAIYTFGDSILDPGNNNVLVTFTQSNHPPYGQDFPGHVPTGRFTNGKLATDILASSFGLKPLLPAYLDPNITPLDLLTGVSFASAGSGFDDLTARRNSVLNIKSEIGLFEECLTKIRKNVGKKRANHIIGNAVLVIAGGTNDVVNNFYVLPTRRATFSLSGYHDFLLTNLEGYLRKMYSMGGRKFAVVGLPPVGCLPVSITLASLSPGSQLLRRRACIDQQNIDCQKYNSKLRALLARLHKSLPGSIFGYVDVYKSLMDMISKPAKYGFEHTLEGCCGTGTLEMGYTCNQINPMCENASKYVFFDSVHPTEAAYKNLASTALRDLLPVLLPAGR